MTFGESSNGLNCNQSDSRAERTISAMGKFTDFGKLLKRSDIKPNDLPPNEEVPFIDERVFIWLGWRSGRYSDETHEQRITGYMILDGILMAVFWVMLASWIINTGRFILFV